MDRIGHLALGRRLYRILRALSYKGTRRITCRKEILANCMTMLRRNDPPSQSAESRRSPRAAHSNRDCDWGVGRWAGGDWDGVKGLVARYPAAIIVMLHVAADSNFDLSKWFRQFGHIEIHETRQGERLRGEWCLWRLRANLLPFNMANWVLKHWSGLRVDVRH